MATNPSREELIFSQELVAKIVTASGTPTASWDLQPERVALAAYYVCKEQILQELKESMDKRGLCVTLK